MRHAFVAIVGSSASAQLLLVASTPLLTRLYEESAFGRLGVATTAALVVSTLLTLRLEYALHVSALGASRLYRAVLTNLLMLLPPLAAIALVTAVLLSDAGLTTGIALHASDLAWIPLFAIGHALHGATLVRLNQARRFAALALLVLAVPLAFLMLALTGAALGIGDSALVAWQANAFLLGAGLGLGLARHECRPLPLRRWRAVLRHERDCWRFLVPSQLLSIAALNMAVVGAALLYDAGTAGLVLVAQRIARAPVTMLGNALNEVLRASLTARDALWRHFLIIAASCSLIAVTMIIGVRLLPASSWSLLLGTGWTALGPILAITVIAAAGQLIGTAVASLLTAFDRRSDFLVNLALAATGLAVLLAAELGKLEVLAWLRLQAAANVLVYLAAFLLAWRIARRETRDPALSSTRCRRQVPIAEAPRQLRTTTARDYSHAESPP